MKSKKFAKDTFTFEIEEEGSQAAQDFVELMEHNGVKPLPNKIGKYKISQPFSSKTGVIKPENIAQENLIETHKFSGAQPSHSTPRPKPRKKIKINRQFKPDQTIDLHGLHRNTAIDKVKITIPKALRNNQQTLLIITGKGLHSGEEKGVLRTAVWSYLNDLFQERKIGDFRWAPPFLGGDGAILVFI